MILICMIDLIVVAVLVYIVGTRGIEAALPSATFLCVLLPATARFDIGLFELSAQRVIVIVLLLCYAMGKQPDSGASSVKNAPLLWLMAVQILWCLVSTVSSIVPTLSIKKLLSEVGEYYALYYVYVKAVTSIHTIHRILFGMVAAAVACSVFGAVEAYTGWTVLGLFPAGKPGVIGQVLGIVSGPDGRVASTFPHAILFGAALSIAITVALYLVSVAETPGRKYFLWAAMLLMFLNAYKTVSRGPWLGLVLAFTLLLILGNKTIRKYQAVIAALSLAVLIIRPGVWDTIRNLYSETFDYGSFDTSSEKGLSFDYRLVLRHVAQKALDKDFSRELWGYGMESFTYLGLKGDLAGHEFPFLSCDSAWIELMVETGYVGLFLIALLLLTPAWLAWCDYRRIRGPDRYLAMTLLICMVTYYFMMTSVDMYAWGQEGYILWILIALSIVCGRLNETDFQPQPALRNTEAFSTTFVTRPPRRVLSAGGDRVGHSTNWVSTRRDPY
jgi:O-antigen ligase